MILDIHSHIIPGIDDGSPNMDVSLDMIKSSVEQGVTDIIATPHYYFGKYISDVSTVKQKFNELKEAVKAHNINVNLYLGQEIYVSNFETVISMLKNKELLTMNNSDVLLIEFNPLMKPELFDDVVYNFSVNNYKVVIAHVERYPWMKLDDVKYLKNEGAFIQINSNSLLNHHADRSEYVLAKKALKLGLVDYIASDMHSFRRSHLGEAYKKYCKHYKNINDPSLFNL